MQGGSFRFQESGYAIKRVKVEHVDYAGDDYVLRFLAYPATYNVSETSTSGYGAVIDVRFVSATKDFEIGEKYQLISDSSRLVIYPEIPKGDTTYHDTIYYHIASGELRVDTSEGYRTFKFDMLTADGDSIVGSYLGEYTYNYGDALSVIAGLRGDWFNHVVDGSSKFKVSPRLTVKYIPVDEIVIRANGGRGLRYSTPLVDNIGVFSTGKNFYGDYNQHRHSAEILPIICLSEHLQAHTSAWIISALSLPSR